MQKTSLLAHAHMIQSGKKATHSDLILTALMGMPQGGQYEEIAMRCGLQPVQVHRRLAEVVGIKRTGRFKPTSSSVPAEVWVYEKPAFNNNCEQGKMF